MVATGPEVFVAIMTKFLSDSYDALEETLNHIKSLKLKNYSGENVTDCCAEILVDAERLESAGAFNSGHLGYITRIFEDTSDSKSVCGLFRSTRGLRSLLRNFMCVTWISYHKRIS